MLSVAIQPFQIFVFLEICGYEPQNEKKIFFVECKQTAQKKSFIHVTFELTYFLKRKRNHFDTYSQQCAH